MAIGAEAMMKIPTSNQIFLTLVKIIILKEKKSSNHQIIKSKMDFSREVIKTFSSISPSFSGCVDLLNSFPTKMGVIPIPIAAIALMMISDKDPELDISDVMYRAVAEARKRAGTVTLNDQKKLVAQMARDVTIGTSIETLSIMIENCSLLDTEYMKD
jgi:hypothetical protein